MSLSDLLRHTQLGRRRRGVSIGLGTLTAVALAAGVAYYVVSRVRRMQAQRPDDGDRPTAPGPASRPAPSAPLPRSGLAGRDPQDLELAARVRSALGELMAYAGGIAVEARAGHVTLRGPVLEDERDEIMARVAALPGVTGVDNQLEVHGDPWAPIEFVGDAKPAW